MRDIALIIVLGLGMVGTLRFPYVGVLLWTWLTLMVPHQQTFGFAQFFPVNLMVAITTIIAVLFSKERKLPPNDATLTFTLLFLAWITLNGFQAINPAWSWPLWDRTWRIIVLGILISITANNRTRIHALILVVALSLLFYGVKGGAFTLLTGGSFHVVGPPASMIGDNNQLALAVLMVLPIANYVRLHSANILIRRIVLVAIILSMISVLGSYSRGAFLALAGLIVIAWFRAKRKLLYPFVAVAIVWPAFHFMPQTYLDRIGSIQNAQADSSMQGRIDAWHVAFSYAKDHFPFGAGFSGPELPQVFNLYAPGRDTHAAHSIYFQVLGDNGFLGLALYLTIIWLCFWNSMILRRQTKKRPELLWVYDLAGMIQLMLFVFCVGGSALSFAYYDLLFIAAGLLSAMRVMVTNQTKHAQARMVEAPTEIGLATNSYG